MNYTQACKWNRITRLKYATQRIVYTRIKRYGQKSILYKIYLDTSPRTIEYQHC